MLGNITFTAKGRQYLNKAQTGTTINITRVVVGDGTYTGAFADATALQHQVISLPITRKKVEGVLTQLEALLTNQGLAAGFYIRELGIMATDGTTEILFAYDNAGAEADYIASEANGPARQILFRPQLLIGNEANVTINTSGAIYTTQADFDAYKAAAENPTFSSATGTIELESGEPHTTILGKIAKAISTLLTHLADKANPHAVTTNQIGAMPLKGGNFSGDTTYGKGANLFTGPIVERAIGPDTFTAQFAIGNDGGGVLQVKKNGTETYRLNLGPSVVTEAHGRLHANRLTGVKGTDWDTQEGNSTAFIIVASDLQSSRLVGLVNGVSKDVYVSNSDIAAQAVGVKSNTDTNLFTFGNAGVAPGEYLLTSYGSAVNFRQTATTAFVRRDADTIMVAGIGWGLNGLRPGNTAAWVRQDHFPDIPENISYLQFNTVVR